jgi:basic membrane protein A and related proteins
VAQLEPFFRGTMRRRFPPCPVCGDGTRRSAVRIAERAEEDHAAMMMNTKRAVALVMAGALVLTACGDAPEDEPETTDEAAEPTDDADEADEADEGDDEAAEPAEDVDFQGCQVTDTGGIDDRSFNQTVWAGFQRAEDELGIEIANLESNSESDYEPHINTFIEQGCELIVTVGFLLEEATAEAAEANPDQNFGIIDAAPEGAPDNLLGMIFATDEAAFLAGYAAADTTETGIVGTWGGLPIPPVTIFMDGFLAGVEYYNQENGTDVEVLGWDGEDGVFTNDFDAQDLGANVTSDLLQNGADIIMPVAGPAGLGTATAIDSFGSGMMIWVDTDGYESTSFGSIILTSVEKRMDNAVYDIVEQTLNDNFTGGIYEGTLENDGVGLAPFHDFEDEVSDGLQAELDEIREGIISGDITVGVGDHA